MKKILFLIVIFVLALGAGCKKKVEPTPPPPPPPVEKQSQQELMKGFVSMVSDLKPGEVIPVIVNKEKFTSDYSVFNVSLFPLEFKMLEEWKSLVKYSSVYRFPSIVLHLKSKYMGERDSQLQIRYVKDRYLQDYSTVKEDGDLVWILKDSPKGTPPFENIPTLLVEAEDGSFWVLNQNGDEMPRW